MADNSTGSYLDEPGEKADLLSQRAFRLTIKAEDDDGNGRAADAHADAAKAYRKAANAKGTDFSAKAHWENKASYHDGQAKQMRILSGVMNHQTLSENAWSDAARQAAKLAREASHAAHDASYNSGHEGATKLASKAAGMADEAHDRAEKGHDNVGYHVQAAEHHEKAGKMHEKAQKQERKAGDADSAGYSGEAAAKNYQAAQHHRDAIKHYTANAADLRTLIRNRLLRYLTDNCGGKGGRPGPCPGAKRKGSPSAPGPATPSTKGFGHVKAAQGKIDKINATLAAAKLRVASIAKQLKDAKVNLKAVAAEVKRNVDALARRVRPGKGNPAAPPVVTAPPEGARIPSTVKANPIAPRPGDEDYVGKPSHTGMFDLDIEEEMAVKSHK